MDKVLEEENKKMLLDIYKNLDMATWSIDIIDDEIIDDDFLELVRSQKKMYETSKSEAMDIADKYHIDLKNINMMAKWAVLPVSSLVHFSIILVAI